MRRPAAESEPSATTAAKLRQSAQSGSETAIPFNPVWRLFNHRQFRITSEWTIFHSSTAKRRAEMNKGKVVVLGANGHIGHAVAQAFVNAGWDVTGMARSDKHAPGVRFVKGDSDSVEDMRRAIGDAEIVVNALNMRYDQWF